MIRRVIVMVLSLACADAALASEDIDFLAEHAVESGMDATYMALPWPAGRLAPSTWQPSVDLTVAHTTTAFMHLSGNAVALSAARALNARWGYELVASQGTFELSGHDGRVPPSSRFLAANPVDLPPLADFSAVGGRQRQLGVGAAIVHERREADSASSSQLLAGVMLERVAITPLRMDYRLQSGVNAATGTLEYESHARFATPFVALQQTRVLAPRWAWSLRAMLIAPLPPRALDARLTGPQLDPAAAQGGKVIAIGDPFVVLGLAFRHRPSGLEIDLGGPVYYTQAESASHHGVDGARVLHVAWRHGSD